jgi:bifunctional N-acetylglucosamine-1-phosphate-uridyltransferase/glucosamine-1-phosphate-acetyltransferase GlmU-like protein
LLGYVLDALSFIEKKDTVIVVGYKKNEIIGCFEGYAFAEQAQQLGTGHAVMAAGENLLGFDGAVLVCYGDMPLIRQETYRALISEHLEQENDCTILTGESEIRLPYGRIQRDDDGGFLAVVEESDCTQEQLEIAELNSGVYVFQTPLLLDALKSIRPENAQGEYYLTDVPAIMRGGGAKVGLCRRSLGSEILGVNTSGQLSLVEEIIRKNNKK